MSDLPTINNVTALGIIRYVEHRPGTTFPWKFSIEIPSTYRSNEAMLTCGVAGNVYGAIVEQTKIGTDWVLVNGKIRTGGFIQTREMCIIDEPKLKNSAIHHVSLAGKIDSIKHYTNSIYEWQFDLSIFPEYGNVEEKGVEAILTCGVGGKTEYGETLRTTQEGNWATVQGKIRNNGFIQVRSMTVFDVTEI